MIFLSNGGIGHRVVQVCVVFQLPKNAIPELFPMVDLDTVPTHLAYVKWFSPIPSTPNANLQMYQVSRLVQNGHQQATIIPIETVWRVTNHITQ